MLAICTDSEPRIDEILLSLLAELAEEREERQRLVDRAGLWGVFWKQLKVAFGYEPEKPSLKGFLLDLFLAGYERVLGEGGSLILSQTWEKRENHFSPACGWFPIRELSARWRFVRRQPPLATKAEIIS